MLHKHPHAIILIPVNFYKCFHKQDHLPIRHLTDNDISMIKKNEDQLACHHLKASHIPYWFPMDYNRKASRSKPVRVLHIGCHHLIACTNNIELRMMYLDYLNTI